MRRVPPLAVATAAVALVVAGAWAVVRRDATPSEACRAQGTVAGRFAPFRPSDSVSTFSSLITEESFPEGLAWLAVDSPSQMRREGGRVRLLDPRRLGGRLAPPASFEAERDESGEAASELGDGATVVFVVTAYPAAQLVASLRRDGSVVLLGGCHPFHMGTLRGFVAKRNASGDTRSPAQIFAALPADRALLGALHEYERFPNGRPKTWHQLRPEQRMVPGDGPARAPADVRARLTTRMVHFRFPREWREFDASLALFIPGVGWYEAVVPFELDSDDPALPASMARDLPFELWAVPSAGDLSRPLARLAVVQPSHFLPREDVHLVSRVEVASLDELVARAKTGEAIFGTGP